MAELRGRGRVRLWALAWLWAFVPASVAPARDSTLTPVESWRATQVVPGELAWAHAELGAIRGVTIGPIESALHPDRGYGSAAFVRTVHEAKRLGATWVSLTTFGRIWDLKSTAVSPTFEAPFTQNKRAVMTAVRQAHAAGLRVLLVPHLWVEQGGWRGELEPGDDAAWELWTRSYRDFVLGWAEVARDAHADMLAVGIELRSWLTTTRATSFAAVLRDVRHVYPGLLTYAGNWDDVEQTVILGELDLIGLNAFFPLADRPGASAAELALGAQRVAAHVRELAEAWHKPILFTEFGYTTRSDPALRPWEWPDQMSQVRVDEEAQADAYRALLSAFISEPWFAGLFVWRLYADPDDMSQEAEWGFSPRGKSAELVLRDAFNAHWGGDGQRPIGAALIRSRAERVGDF